MLAIQQSAPRGVRSDLDLTLEKVGSAWGRTQEEREAFAVVADILGCGVAAEHVRAVNRRRAQVKAVPDDPRRPLKSRQDRRPILAVVDGEAEANPRREHMLAFARLAEEGVRSEWATHSERSAWAAAARQCREAAQASH